MQRSMLNESTRTSSIHPEPFRVPPGKRAGGSAGCDELPTCAGIWMIA